LLFFFLALEIFPVLINLWCLLFFYLRLNIIFRLWFWRRILKLLIIVILLILILLRKLFILFGINLFFLLCRFNINYFFWTLLLSVLLFLNYISLFIIWVNIFWTNICIRFRLFSWLIYYSLTLLKPFFSKI
jgi:hypothetical protein